MSLLVVGSVAYDSVRTPAGRRDRALGGSAVYFALAASYLTDVSLVGIVGQDFDDSHIELLRSRAVDVSGLERVDGKTFHWSGVYSSEDVNQRETLDTHLNVFADFKPELNGSHRASDIVFLANIDPVLQLEVLNQMDSRPTFTALDSMDFWIDGRPSELARVVGEVDLLFLDEGETRSFAGEFNLVRAARKIQQAGPRAVVVKRGEHGVLVVDGEEIFAAPAFPLEGVVDPTGAGDSFAGGFMGTVAATGDTTTAGLRRAAVVGSVMGSFTVQAFSTERLQSLSSNEIRDRFGQFQRITSFDDFDCEGGFPRRPGTVVGGKRNEE